MSVAELLGLEPRTFCLYCLLGEGLLFCGPEAALCKPMPASAQWLSSSGTLMWTLLAKDLLEDLLESRAVEVCGYHSEATLSWPPRETLPGPIGRHG